MTELSSNTRVASALLHLLGSTGDVGGRARALRAAGEEGANLQEAGVWLPGATLRAMFQAVPVDAGLARRIGQALVSPSSVVLALTYSGVATVEKAYRRVDRLLARESQHGSFSVDDIRDGLAYIRYSGGSPNPADAVYCSMRVGMLQAMPLAFGLLPAAVREVECVHRGGEACSYQVEWSRTSRKAMALGAIFGVSVGSGLFTALQLGYVLPPGWVIAAGVLVTLLCTAVGRAIDLGRQLQAVAGARRGHLALLDQADRALAERMDELAKLDAAVASGDGQTGPEGPAATSAPLDVAGSARLVRASEHSKHLAAHVAALAPPLAELRRRWVEEGGWTHAQVQSLIEASIDALRGLETAHHDLARTLADSAQPDTDEEEGDLPTLVRRVSEEIRAGLRSSQTVAVEVEESIAPVDAPRHQLEQVVVQLIRNAAVATADGGRIEVALRDRRNGVELVVKDDGVGMEADDLERVFDPYLAHSVAGVDTAGLGLPICYRIVTAHGGELSVDSAVSQGTRVTVWLPASR